MYQGNEHDSITGSKNHDSKGGVDLNSSDVFLLGHSACLALGGGLEVREMFRMQQ